MAQGQLEVRHSLPGVPCNAASRRHMSGRWRARSGPKQKILVTMLPGPAENKAWASVLFQKCPMGSLVVLDSSHLCSAHSVLILQIINSFVLVRVQHKMGRRWWGF